MESMNAQSSMTHNARTMQNEEDKVERYQLDNSGILRYRLQVRIVKGGTERQMETG